MCPWSSYNLIQYDFFSLILPTFSRILLKRKIKFSFFHNTRITCSLRVHWRVEVSLNCFFPPPFWRIFFFCIYSHGHVGLQAWEWVLGPSNDLWSVNLTLIEWMMMWSSTWCVCVWGYCISRQLREFLSRQWRGRIYIKYRWQSVGVKKNQKSPA